MDALRQDQVSVDDFLAWIADRDGRFELVDGRILMMAGATVRHNIVANNITVALTPMAKRYGCRSSTSDMAVRTGVNSLRYPDVMVDCGPPDYDALIASSPTVIVEVSSPGTAQVDAVVKLDEYRRLPTVQAVIQVEPDFVLVSVHRRGSGADWQTEIYESLDDVIALPALGGSLALADIYDTLSVKPRPRVQLVGDKNQRD